MRADLLKNELRRDEGCVRHAYRDSEGYLSIGVGRLIDARKGGGLSDDEIQYLLTNDIMAVVADLDRALPWWRKLNAPRQEALANMAFNLGINGLLKFKQTLRALESGDYIKASTEMLKSKWAKQVGKRAVRLSNVVFLGERIERT